MSDVVLVCQQEGLFKSPFPKKCTALGWAPANNVFLSFTLGHSRTREGLAEGGLLGEGGGAALGDFRGFRFVGRGCVLLSN